MSNNLASDFESQDLSAGPGASDELEIELKNNAAQENADLDQQQEMQKMADAFNAHHGGGVVEQDVRFPALFQNNYKPQFRFNSQIFQVEELNALKKQNTHHARVFNSSSKKQSSPGTGSGSGDYNGKGGRNNKLSGFAKKAGNQPIDIDQPDILVESIDNQSAINNDDESEEDLDFALRETALKKGSSHHRNSWMHPGQSHLLSLDKFHQGHTNEGGPITGLNLGAPVSKLDPVIENQEAESSQKRGSKAGGPSSVVKQNNSKNTSFASKEGLPQPMNLKMQRTITGSHLKRLTKLKPPKSRCKARTEKFMNSYFFQGLMTIITLYCLFGDDIRQLAFNADQDQYFYICSSISFFFFGLEIVLSCIVRDDYWLGFYFWLDIISTVSLIADIGWIMSAISGTGTGQASNSSNIQQATKLARAGRGARIGTKAARLARIIRLIRLLRIVKLYKSANLAFGQNEEQNTEIAEQSPQEPTVAANTETPAKEGSDSRNDEENQQNHENHETKRPESAQRLLRPPSTQVGSGDNQQLILYNPLKLPGTGNNESNTPKRSVTVRGSAKVVPSSLGQLALPSVSAFNQYSAQHQQEANGSVLLSKQLTPKKPIELKDQSENPTPPSDPPKKDNSKQMAKQEAQKELPQESKVGLKLSDLTTKRVIILVLSMLITQPLFMNSTFQDENTSFDTGIQLIYLYKPHTEQFNELLQTIIHNQVMLDTPLVFLNFKNITWEGMNFQLSTIRQDDQQLAFINNDLDFIAIYDIRSSNKLKAGLSILNTLFVCVILAGGTLIFSSHCNELVISPIEEMIQKVSRIAENPLIAAQEEENEAIALEKMKETGIYLKKNGTKKKQTDEILETDVLESTIVKIGALLALVFGEAGSQIIAQNISGTGGLNPILPGQKVLGIFGFCDIRNFTDATEILQQDVMVFVNEIGEIVHGMVDYYSGSPNKNIGDAFLLVWKFLEKDVVRDSNKNNEIMLRDNVSVHQLADMAVISFVKIQAEIKKSRKLVKYSQNQALNERIPNYQVKMGFGMHVGWAIEGSIGSIYKIEASYLSPNVNMASRLEAATKQFGVSLLVSGQLFEIMTPLAQEHFREIDRVTLKGSIEPMSLFTCDVDTSNLQINSFEKPLSKKEQKLRRAKSRIERDRRKQLCFDNQLQVAMKFQIDGDLVEMRSAFTQRFYQLFQQGFECYVTGDWESACEIFQAVQHENIKEDKPTQVLLDYMAEYDFMAPEDWPGYRVLIEK